MTESKNAIPAGQSYRALTLSTLAFTLCFAVWTIFSIVGIQLKEDLQLSDTELGLLMATPILSGSVSRLFLGILTDRFGGRWVFGLVMLVAAGFLVLLSGVTDYVMLLLCALGLGLAGGGFIVGAAYTSGWFGKERQGLALGIFGAGNVGSAVTTFGAPFLLVALGWQGTVQVYAAVLAIAGVVFMALAKSPPGPRAASPTLAQQIAPLAEQRVWRFSLYYFFVFGAFVALALWLPHYLMEVYGLTIVQAGLITSLYTVPGSLFRILGGWLSDKYGARKVMYWTFIASAICTFLLSYPPTEYVVSGVRGEIRFSMGMDLWAFAVLVFTLGFFMSLGKAAVFKHIPVYYPNHVGAVGGMVAMIGGLGGFLLPLTFGMLNDVVGIWQGIFMMLFLIVTLSLGWMHYSIRRAEKLEWADKKQVSDLPEMATPSAFVLSDWRPEDDAFWAEKGKRIATRNLWISIPSLFLSFAVWSIWSIMVTQMPQLGFPYSSNQLFWLAALPALSGATLRIFYGFMVPIFGGRRWTALSTASLVLPCLWMGVALQDTETSYLVMLVLALLCGLGGGNFSSSMANISFFYPKREKGTAMGLNAGLGNLGVSAVQLLGPLVIASSIFGSLGGEPLQLISGPNAGQSLWLQNAALLWVPFIIIVTVAAWFGMNDIASAKASFSDQAVIFRRKHNWLMCVLYMGTFGSFIGFAAGFPLLTGKLFPQIDVVSYAFIGPLVGALARPFGGALSDRFGGARVTLALFLVMVAGVIGVITYLPDANGTGGNFWGFFAMFQVLFVASGAGNGSTFRMVPVMFLNLRKAALGPGHEDQAAIEGNRESAAVLGFISAIAAYGGFFIPKSYGTAIDLTGTANAAFYMFIVFYVVCIGVTWWYYARRQAPVPC